MSREEMIALRRTLSAISTKGEDTVRMAGCLNFLLKKINEAAEVVSAKQEEAKEEQ